jgi:hypothetical protein
MKQDILMAALVDPHLVADASGNEPQSPICVLAGFVASSARWTDFSAAWQAALDEHPKLEYFKMTEAASLRGQFDRRRGWTETKRDEKVLSLVRIIRDHVGVRVSAWIRNDDYDKHIRSLPMPVRHLGNDSPYVMLVNQLVVATATFGDRHGIVTPPQYVFDAEMGFDREALTFWPHVKRTLDLSTRSDIAKFVGEAPSFRDEKDYLPLQAADLYAWQIRNHLLRNNRVPNQTIRIPANPVLATLRTVPMINREYPTDEIQRMRDFLIEQGKLFAEQNPEVALIGPHSDPKLRRKAFRQARKARKHPPQKGPRKPT